MYAVSKVKLTAWMRRPRSSFGLLAGIASFVVLMSLAAWLEQAYDWMLSAPFTLAAFLLVSMATGIVVQHRFTVRLGDALFNSPAQGWQRAWHRLSSWARESNIFLAILLALCVGFPITMFYAVRSVQTIVRDCQQNLEARTQVFEEQGPTTSFSRPLCECLSRQFLRKNGVVRLALFNTRILAITDFKGVTPRDEQTCVDNVLGINVELLSRQTSPNRPWGDLPRIRPNSE
jgi:hypothetical protein